MIHRLKDQEHRQCALLQRTSMVFGRQLGRAFFEWLAEQKADVVCIQETKHRSISLKMRFLARGLQLLLFRRH